MFGRQAKLPVDIVHGSPPTEPLPCHEYAQSLRSRLEVAYSKVKEHLGTAIYRQKEMYDTKVHGQEFKVGDLVRLHNLVVATGASWKLHCPWSRPYTVEKKLSTVVYRIQDTRHGRRNHQIVHFDWLKPCAPSSRIPDGIKQQQTSSNRSKNPASNPAKLSRLPPPGTKLQLFDENDECRRCQRCREKQFSKIWIHRLTLSTRSI